MNSNQYNAYTGTFTNKAGQSRTMTFIRPNDMPSSLFEGKTRPKQTGQGHEIVYDVNAKGFRTFNWETTQGSVSKKIIQHSFDS